MSQDALVKAISAIAAQIQANPEQITKYLPMLQQQFPGITEEKVAALVRQLTSSDLDVTTAANAAKKLFGQ